MLLEKINDKALNFNYSALHCTALQTSLPHPPDSPDSASGLRPLASISLLTLAVPNIPSMAELPLGVDAGKG